MLRETLKSSFGVTISFSPQKICSVMQRYCFKVTLPSRFACSMASC